MTRTPDKIKKGLECCGESQDCTQDNMPKCPYYEQETCLTELVNDALALIQQLEERAHQLDLLNLGLLVEKAQLEAERDAAVRDIRIASTSQVGTCRTCKHCKKQVDCDEPVVCGLCKVEDCPCRTCSKEDSKWEWRGVQKEE